MSALGTGTDPLIRFLRHIEVGDCWLWTASLDKDGYGHFSDYRPRKGSQRAHRWLFERVHRKLRRTEVLDHLCRVRACVNPDHLEPVTAGDNIRRGRTGKDQRRGFDGTGIA